MSEMIQNGTTEVVGEEILTEIDNLSFIIKTER